MSFRMRLTVHTCIHACCTCMLPGSTGPMHLRWQRTPLHAVDGDVLVAFFKGVVCMALDILR